MNALVLVVAMLSMGDSATLTDNVDLVELNHFYDENGKPVLDQLIFYDWDGERHQVVDFRVVKGPDCLPRRLGDHWECFWCDTSRWRRVRCTLLRESWTQHDPELFEREKLAKDRRRGLRMR